MEAFDESEIGAACYGGADVMSGGDGEDSRFVSRTYSAYMLVYERLSAGSDDTRKSMLPKDGKVTVPVPNPILKGVWSDNIQFLMDKNMYETLTP